MVVPENWITGVCSSFLVPEWNHLLFVGDKDSMAVFQRVEGSIFNVFAEFVNILLTVAGGVGTLG